MLVLYLKLEQRTQAFLGLLLEAQGFAMTLEFLSKLLTGTTNFWGSKRMWGLKGTSMIE